MHWSTQIYLRSFVRCLTVKVCLFQKLTSKPPPPTVIMKRKIHPKKLQPPTSKDPEFLLNVTSAEPHHITQSEISDLITDLDLSKKKVELLSSGLQQWYLIYDTVQVTAFRSLQKHFEQFFIKQGGLNDLKNAKGLMAATNITYKSREWLLFIDSSMHGLQAALLHQ